MKKILLFIAFIALLSSCSKIRYLFKNKHTHTVGRILKSKDAEYKYKMAQQFYATKKYYQAQVIFEDIMKDYKGSDKYEDLYYKWVYSLYYEKDYASAENGFKTFTEYFPNSSKAEECQYMRAFCLYKQSPKVDLDQTETTRAIGQMQAFVNMFPTSKKVRDANEIIDICREKLETKESKAAQLYYDLGYFQASAISFASVSENYPDSKRGDEYKLNEIRAYFKYAELSSDEKREERFQKVLSECSDFSERYSESNLLPQVNKYKEQSNNYLKLLKNEQAQETSK